jgi:hypothetical protein
MPVMKLGDHGSAVRELQRLLDLTTATDGWYDEATRAAVMAAQRRFGLVVDGVAGPKTMAALKTGTRPDRLLRDADLMRAADRLDVPLAAVRAVNAVEARDGGFLPDGRPVILFERHVMYRRLKAAGFDADALAARYPNVVNPARGGYAGGAAEHMRLAIAADIAPDIAIESASWGLFQIMGFHWDLLKYGSAQDFAARMRATEGDQLDAFVAFIEADPALHKALKARRWAEFARLYNGPAYKDNLYDIKLARAYAQFSEAVST